MPRVLFAAPRLSPNATGMLRAVAALPGVAAGIVTQEPASRLPADLRLRVAHWRVDEILSVDQLEWAVRSLAERFGGVDRLFGAYEQLQVPLAEVRSRLGIPGMSPTVARRFRDKALMKETLRAAGVPCARHAVVRAAAEAEAFAAQVGYPVVVKPPAGAGAVATARAADPAQLHAALARVRAAAPGQPALLEEFLRGEEHSLETVSIGGARVWHSLTHYVPSPLEVLEQPWVQWAVILPREVDDPRYDDIKQAAARALDALGMDTGLTHMEWFRRADGSVAVGEVGARPPGAQITTLVSRACDIDFVAAWARLMVFGEFAVPERKYAAGAAYLRAQGGGATIAGVEGLDAVQARLGGLVTDAKLPVPGARPTGSYEGDGHLVVRHPETAVVVAAVREIISQVRVLTA